MIAVLAGAFDDPAALSGHGALLERCQPWMRSSGERTRYAKMPE